MGREVAGGLQVGVGEAGEERRGGRVLGQGEPRGQRVAEQELLLQAGEGGAGGGLLVLVYQHVGLQLVRVGEVAGADLALVRPLPGVDPDVPPEVGHLDKLPVAVGTTVWLLS